MGFKDLRISRMAAILWLRMGVERPIDPSDERQLRLANKLAGQPPDRDPKKLVYE